MFYVLCLCRIDLIKASEQAGYFDWIVMFSLWDLEIAWFW